MTTTVIDSARDFQNSVLGPHYEAARLMEDTIHGLADGLILMLFVGMVLWGLWKFICLAMRLTLGATARREQAEIFEWGRAQNPHNRK